MRRFVRAGKLDGVPLYLHWSTIVLPTAALFLAPTRLPLTVVVLLAYFAVLLLHEWGHVLAARRRRCAAHSIELYPILGITRYSMPWSRLDDAFIAWGGVLAQLVVALPLVLATSRHGFEGPELVNAAVAILGHLSLIIAAFNLVPLEPLDGARAWRVLPVLYRGVVAGLGAAPRRRERKRSPRAPRWPASD